MKTQQFLYCDQKMRPIEFRTIKKEGQYIYIIGYKKMFNTHATFFNLKIPIPIKNKIRKRTVGGKERIKTPRISYAPPHKLLHKQEKKIEKNQKKLPPKNPPQSQTTPKSLNRLIVFAFLFPFLNIQNNPGHDPAPF